MKNLIFLFIKIFRVQNKVLFISLLPSLFSLFGLVLTPENVDCWSSQSTGKGFVRCVWKPKKSETTVKGRCQLVREGEGSPGRGTSRKRSTSVLRCTVTMRDLPWSLNVSIVKSKDRLFFFPSFVSKFYTKTETRGPIQSLTQKCSVSIRYLLCIVGYV